MLSLDSVGLRCVDIQDHFVLAMFLLHIQYIGRADNRCFAGYIPVSDVAQTTNRAGIAATDGGAPIEQVSDGNGRRPEIHCDRSERIPAELSLPLQSRWKTMLRTFPSGARTKNRRTPHGSVVNG